MFALSDFCMTVYLGAVEWKLRGSPTEVPEISVWDMMLASIESNQQMVPTKGRAVYYQGVLHNVVA